MTTIFEQPLAVIHLLMLSSVVGLVLNMVVVYLATLLRPVALHRVVANGALAIYFATSLLTFTTMAQVIRYGSASNPVVFLGWVAVLVFVGALYALARRRRLQMAIVAAMMLIYNGAVADLLGDAYTAAYIAIQVVLIIFAGRDLLALWQYGLRTATNLSVKSAFDLIDDGLVFTDAGGSVVLSNDAMDRIVAEAGISVRKTGKKLWDNISAQGSPIEGDDEGRLLLRAPQAPGDATTPRMWLMQRSPVDAGPHHGLDVTHQIQGTDVSELGALASQLRQEVALQEDATQALREALATTDELTRALAREVSRGRVHDLIAQRISIIRRFMEDEITDPKAVKALAAMITDLRTELASPTVVGATVLWAMMKRGYATAGFAINTTGALPQDEQVARAFVRIVRQACANAILHASASSVDVMFETTPEADSVTIANDGPAAGAVVEGNGIKNMRRQLDELGGTLCIITDDRFTLYVRVPKPHPNG